MEARIAQIGRRLHSLVQALRGMGYHFENDNEVITGPELGTAEAIRRIEAEFGSCPLALKLFWERIGSVDLSGTHPDWIDDRYPDQLVVFPPSIAHWEMKDYLGDIKEKQKCGLGYEIPIAPDFYHKAGVSGGEPYSISLPTADDDPILRNSQVRETFLEYVERSLNGGGFPGMIDEADHNWPLQALIDVAR